MRTTLPALAPILLLAACGGGTATVKSATRPLPPPPTVVKPTPAKPPARPRILAAPGLEGVIGASGGDLERQFGTARLDVLEGDARKLQFSGNACVLDVFLYPQEAGQEPHATYVEARRASDGRDVDRASCVAALRKR
ncbi:hypothetical protein [Novosphingobium sp. TH158]|uniref:hypothetical protein n=1 Tax=Novosphingobium sp. TH158 TaxID=2067455 RepID=UPI000C7E06A2|nr:hypothetical protein [Novosphingobium sp. TH158]PLK27260.1 hypothetical protein C0V78_10450 [Novosphingobium sp. TH158]